MSADPIPTRRTDTAAVVAAMDPAAPATTPGLTVLCRVEVLVLALATASLPVLTDLAILTPQLAADIGSGLLAVAAGLHLPGVVASMAAGRRPNGGG